MGRLTSEERRRVFLAQERNRQTMLARMSVAPAVDIDHDGAGRPWRRRLLKTMLTDKQLRPNALLAAIALVLLVAGSS